MHTHEQQRSARADIITHRPDVGRSIPEIIEHVVVLPALRPTYTKINIVKVLQQA